MYWLALVCYVVMLMYRFGIRHPTLNAPFQKTGTSQLLCFFDMSCLDFLGTPDRCPPGQFFSIVANIAKTTGFESFCCTNCWINSWKNQTTLSRSKQQLPILMVGYKIRNILFCFVLCNDWGFVFEKQLANHWNTACRQNLVWNNAMNSPPKKHANIRFCAH